MRKPRELMPHEKLGMTKKQYWSYMIAKEEGANLKPTAKAVIRYEEDKLSEAEEKHREWIMDNPEEYVLERTKRRARAGGHKFNLTLEDIIIPERCPALGIPISVLSHERDSGVSVDKVRPKKGYTKGNVVVVSMKTNRVKAHATPEELQLIAKFYERYIED